MRKISTTITFLFLFSCNFEKGKLYGTWHGMSDEKTPLLLSIYSDNYINSVSESTTEEKTGIDAITIFNGNEMVFERKGRVVHIGRKYIFNDNDFSAKKIVFIKSMKPCFYLKLILTNQLTVKSSL